MDLQGEGARTDISSAHRLLTAAADLGHAGAMVELARLYEYGRGVSRSSARAAELALKAVQAGHKEGRYIDLTNQGWSFATRRQIQKQLAAKGLYDGGIHGFFNSATRQALTAVAQR